MWMAGLKQNVLMVTEEEGESKQSEKEALESSGRVLKTSSWAHCEPASDFAAEFPTAFPVKRRLSLLKGDYI